MKMLVQKANAAAAGDVTAIEGTDGVLDVPQEIGEVLVRQHDFVPFEGELPAAAETKAPKVEKPKDAKPETAAQKKKRLAEEAAEAAAAETKADDADESDEDSDDKSDEDDTTDDEKSAE